MMGEQTTATLGTDTASPVDGLLINRPATAFADMRTFYDPSAPRDLPEADAWFEADDTARFILDTEGRVLRTNAKARALADCGMVGSRGLSSVRRIAAGPS